MIAIAAALVAAVVALGYRNSRPRRQPPRANWHTRSHE